MEVIDPVVGQRRPGLRQWVARIVIALGVLLIVGISLGSAGIRFLTYHPITARTRVEYYDNGVVESAVEQRLNSDLNYSRHGTARYFYPSGRLKLERQWRFGIPCGVSRLWAEDGTLIYEVDLGPCPDDR